MGRIATYTISQTFHLIFLPLDSLFQGIDSLSEETIDVAEVALQVFHQQGPFDLVNG